jgi:uncharacterized protein (DUF433 family)
MESLMQTLSSRDGVVEAKEQIREMLAALRDGEDIEEILYEYGLEPDYGIDLLLCAERFVQAKSTARRLP